MAAPQIPFPWVNDGSFLSQWSRVAQQGRDAAQPSGVAEAAAHTGRQHSAATASSPEARASEPGDGSGPDFFAAFFFEGKWPGYVFKLGSQGLGYYLDHPPQPQSEPAAGEAAEQPAAAPAAKAPAAAAKKPFVLKTNKPVIAVRTRTGDALAAVSNKKRKADSVEDKPKYLQELERFRAHSCASDSNHDRPLVK